jgi:hypothetical protein
LELLITKVRSGPNRASIGLAHEALVGVRHSSTLFAVAPARMAGVVFEHVEAPGLLLDQQCGGGRARVVGHVQRYAERVDAGRAQFLHRGLPALIVAGADADAPAEGAQARRPRRTGPQRPAVRARSHASSAPTITGYENPG